MVDQQLAILAQIPAELPTEFSDALSWLKARDGFRTALYRACYGDGPDRRRSKVQFAKELALFMKEEEDRIPCRPRSADGIQECLSAFFGNRKDADLPLAFLSTLLIFLGVDASTLRSWLHPAPPFDVWRGSWRTAKGGPAAIEFARLKMDLHRVQPTTAKRVISAYLRSWPELPERPPSLYTSPASGFVYVQQGSVSVRFLGRTGKTLELQQGSCLLYNMRHPHSFRPLTEDTVLLDVTATPHGGVPNELFVNKWDAPKFDEVMDESNERLVEDSVCRLIAFALSSTHVSIDELSQHTTINSSRLRKIAHGDVTPRLEEVLEVAHLCRFPEESLFTPFSKYMDHSVCTGPIELLGDISGLKLLEPDTHSWYLLDTKGKPTVKETAAWQLRAVGRPPTFIQGTLDELEVSVFTCSGPISREASQPVDHDKERPAEELIYVLQGSLGVRLQVGEEGNVCNGVLNEGDAVWFNTKMRHSFWAPNGKSSRSVHFRQPFARSRDL